MRVALFGGSFNPPHVGHLLAATYARAVAGVEALWLMPAWRHPFGKPLAPFGDRVALCEAMAGLVADASVSRVEEELGGEGRTIHAVQRLRTRYPEHAFRLVVGADILAESPRWTAFEELVELSPLIVVGRAGHPMPEEPPPGLGTPLYLAQVRMPAVSSTEVRRRLAAGEDATALVPAVVLEEIRRRHLYGT